MRLRSTFISMSQAYSKVSEICDEKFVVGVYQVENLGFLIIYREGF